MTQLIASNKLKVVVGIGATGLSVARHLAQLGERFVMLDTRQQPPCLEQLKAELPKVPVFLGELELDSFDGADEVILSPGLSRQNPTIQAVLRSGIPVVNDIELFARAANAPIVAITGSNGKSTVTTLVGEMCKASGVAVGVGGNLGIPALALLDERNALYVLELSSFQLESVFGLSAEVATVLNISPDHMDRYASMLDYHQAKHRIFGGARQVVVNREDKLSIPLVSDTVKQWSFGLNKPDFGGFGLLEHESESWLAYQFKRLMPESELAIKGSHNTSNALAALALGSAVGLPMAEMLQVLRQFRGLPHRCHTVKKLGGVTYINDSKATNVGAALAAIEGLSGDENVILLAGGQAKGQDFKPLAKALAGSVKQLILIGDDAALIGDVVGVSIPTVYATNMKAAVEAAHQAAEAGDVVLLSPACASFDMFSSFEDRGNQFVSAVEGLQ